MWLNAGSGTFSDSGNSLGSSYSHGVSLGDVDGDGDLDAVVANGFNQANRVWLNLNDGDGDGVPDASDNCPAIANPGQENLDADAFGNVCDDDVDGDGTLNAADPDDDNDGASDVDELANGTDPFDPDSDDDEIIDSLDREPLSTLNNLCLGQGPDATFSMAVNAQFTCATTQSITVILPGGVDPGGDLWLISPTVNFQRVDVDGTGIMKVLSRDPTAPVP